MEKIKEVLAQNRIEMNLTSTGKVSYSVKAYGDTIEEIDELLGKLLEVADKRKKQLEVAL